MSAQPDPVLDAAERIRRLQARLDRERRARHEAERLLETKSLELYVANQALAAFAAQLEARVAQRTQELTAERQRALHNAEIDPLTGIANRAAFGRQLDDALNSLAAQGAAPAQGVAVLLIDLDDFKAINDTLGHIAGDALLVEFARRLVAAVRPGDTVARRGGDEFAVLARGAGGQQGLLQMAQRVLRDLCRPVVLNGHSLPCTCSIGVAHAGAPVSADALLQNVDVALHASKRLGRGRITWFDAALRDDVRRQAALDAQVRLAVADDHIEPWYQPIVDAASGRAIGAEVLARWHLPGGEVRGPHAFLPSVEALGLLDAMMDAMLRRAFREARPFIDDGSLGYLSINVSPSQFNQGWARERLPALLVEAGFPADRLVVEITETALLDDLDRTRAMLAALAATGIRIALDDFGIGYSNFSLLLKLPIDILKLDRSLVCDLEGDAHARALAECLLDLAARLGMKMVAEGVETEGQAQLLAAAGCPTMQGYWFARPQRQVMPATAPLHAHLAAAAAI